MIALVLLAAAALKAGVSDQTVAAELRAKDETLLSAVHRGGRADRDRHTTPDFVYVEEGLVTSRANLLNTLEPDALRRFASAATR